MDGTLLATALVGLTLGMPLIGRPFGLSTCRSCRSQVVSPESLTRASRHRPKLQLLLQRDTVIVSSREGERRRSEVFGRTKCRPFVGEDIS